MKRHSYLLGYLALAAAAVFAVSASAQSNQNSASPRERMPRPRSTLLLSFQAIVPNPLRAPPMDIPISPECGLRSTEL